MKTPKFLTSRLRPDPLLEGMPEPFRQLCALEPRLTELWKVTRTYALNWDTHPDWSRRWVKQDAWHGNYRSPFLGIEPALSTLLGPSRQDRDDILGSRHAYDCAYKALLDALYCDAGEGA